MPSPLDHAQACTMLVKKIISDGMGGYHTVWEDGAEFPCLIGKSGSVDQLIAQQAGNAGVFQITVEKTVPIDFNDVFRGENGRIYRVTQDPDDNPAPDEATFDVKVGQAESYVLPAG
mgnify:FL=1